MSGSAVVLAAAPIVRNAIVIVANPDQPGDFIMLPARLLPAQSAVEAIGESFASDDLDGLRAMAAELSRRCGLPVLDRADATPCDWLTAGAGRGIVDRDGTAATDR